MFKNLLPKMSNVILQDGQDETGCRTECSGEGGQEFFCAGQGRCLPMRHRCDGFVDCTSGL